MLLSDTVKKKVSVIKKPLHGEIKTLYSMPADSLYKEMMQESDNFIAEQLLLMCANVLSDSLQPEIAIRYMKKNHLMDLPDDPRWIDGSGLSRYNLFTPRSMVKLWEKIYETVPSERLFPILAIGGKTGTVKNHYKNEPPYLYGKTGTLSNNHSLSGYLITRKGRTFIFSFMSNNHPATAATVRTEMEKILKEIYRKY
jgi:serine-type D-Ala-D-Ala carboxypeptidase/endopeptidase (penicillin-binding protein 4)